MLRISDNLYMNPSYIETIKILPAGGDIIYLWIKFSSGHVEEIYNEGEIDMIINWISSLAKGD